MYGLKAVPFKKMSSRAGYSGLTWASDAWKPGIAEAAKAGSIKVDKREHPA